MKADIYKIIQQAQRILQCERPQVSIEIDTAPSFGDYSTNIAMKLFPFVEKEKWKTPRALAEAFVQEMNHSLPSFLSAIELAGPGFINFTLSEDCLHTHIEQTANNPMAYIEQIGVHKRVVVEYSSPNIAKPFTIGHLRSTIIGDAIANLFTAQGYSVYRDNHLGDWGTQFGKLIYAIKQWGNMSEIESSDRPVKLLVDLYIKFHSEAEKNPELEEEGRKWFYKLEHHDTEAKELWQKCIDWSWKEFSSMYAQLGTVFTENNGRGFGESYFENNMEPVLVELTEKKLLQNGEDGAKLVFFPKNELPPFMVLKKDGSTLYSTRDLATDRFRLETYGNDVLIINEVGNEQTLYFQQLYKTEELLGWVQKGQRVHVKHGHFRFKDVKMSTRKGNVIWLEDVLKEGINRAMELAKDKRVPAAAVGIGAIKWNDLKHSSQLDVIFDWDEMLRMQGNSGPYVQYALVRCKSVLQKAHENKQIVSSIQHHSMGTEERSLAVLLHKFGGVIHEARSEYAPHYVCAYLYELAQRFNVFYAQCSILDGGEYAEERLLLTLAVSRVLETGLGILGIQVPEKM